MRKFFIGWIVPLILAGAVSLWIYFAFRDRLCIVDDDSMSPALRKGQVVALTYENPVSRNAIVAIDNPCAPRNAGYSPSLKRCVGMPGDTVLIVGKQLYINGVRVNSDFCMYDRNLLLLNDREIAAANMYGIPACRTDEMLKVPVTEGVFRKIISDSIIVNASTDFTPRHLYDCCLYPFSKFYHWNKDYYGPIVVPCRGMTINLDIANYVMYKSLIERYEGVKMEWRGGVCRVDGTAADSFTFRHGYVFLLNDYRDNPSDSRTFGPVPLELVTAGFKSVLKNN